SHESPSIPQSLTPPSTLSLHDALPIFPEHHADGIDVGAAIDRLARDLLGRHVAELALDDAGLRLDHRGAELRDAEVENFDLPFRSEEHTSELQSPDHIVCRLLLEKKHI